MDLCSLVLSLMVTLEAGRAVVSAGVSTCSGLVYPAVDEGQVKVAAVLGMRNSDGDKCNSMYSTRSLQNAIALNWAAHLLNGNNLTSSFIPGVKIGIDVYDDCNTKYLASSHAGTLASYIKEITDCSVNSDSFPPDVLIAGVITSSASTTIIASILEQTFVPVLGPSPRLAELNDKRKYPNFIRTTPSDLRQAEVIINLAKQFSWSYIVGVSTSDSYGTEGISELMRRAKEERICVLLVPDFDQFDETEMEKFVRTTLANKLKSAKHKLGIVYFGLQQPLMRFFKFVKQRKSFWSKADNQLFSKIYWLASDAEGPSQKLVQTIAYSSTNLLVVRPFLVNVSSFEDYFEDLIKHPPAWLSVPPWRLAFSSIVKVNYGCNNYNFTEDSLAGCNIKDFLDFDTSTPSFLDAFYLLANTLKIIHHNACKGAAGSCDEFQLILTNGLLKSYELLDLDYSAIDPAHIPQEFVESQRKLRNISKDFQASNQPLYSLLAMKDNNFIQVGGFKDGQMTMSKELTTTFSSSECRRMCEECLDLEHLSYRFYPGDVIFLGIFSILGQSDKDPYKCGAYREKSTSYVAMEAFINAINYLNNSTGIKFGYLILDDCYSSLTLTRLLNGVLSGDITVASGNQTFQASKVAVAIGAESSHVTMASLPILTELNIPMISYSATTPDLDNRIMFPYFSRTVSSDTEQARAFVDILKLLNVTYVGAIVISNNYGLELYKLFRSMAESEQICVDDAKEVTVLTPREIYSTFLQDYKNKNIQVIMVIAMGKAVSTFLTAAKREDVFIFIGSEAWGPNLDIIDQDNGKKARGALVLGAATVQLNYDLKDHMQSLDAFNKESTVWLKDFWQDEFQCDLPGEFRNTHEGITCDRSANLSLLVDRLVLSPLAVHASLATMSAGHTVRSFLQNNKQMPFNPREFTAALHSVQLMSSTEEIEPFLGSGSGNLGFDIYSVQPYANSKDKYGYVNVGSYKSSTGLSLNLSQIKFYDAAGHVIDRIESSCIFVGLQCQAVCVGSQPYSSDVGVPTIGTINGRGSATSSEQTTVSILAVFFGLSLLVVIVLIVLGFLACTGRLKFRGRHLPMNNNHRMSSQIILDNSYDGINNSSSSNVPPPLPCRNTAGKKVAYSNKALSEIASPKHLESYPSRNRAHSLPEFSPPARVKAPSRQPSTLLDSPQHLRAGSKVGHHPFNESYSISDTDQTRLKQNGLPAMISSDTEVHGQQFFAKHARNCDLPDGFYKNEHNCFDILPDYQPTTICFHNVPNSSARYSQTPSTGNGQQIVSIVNHADPVFIPVQSNSSLVYLPLSRRDLDTRKGSYNQCQADILLHQRPDHQILQSATDLSVLGSYEPPNTSRLLNSGLSTDYITTTDVQYTTCKGNRAIPEPSARGSPNLRPDQTAAVGFQAWMHFSNDAGTLPSTSPDETRDLCNYVPSCSHGKEIANPKTDFMLNTQSQAATRPSKLDQFGSTSLNSEPLMSPVQQKGSQFKHIVRPNNLPLAQVELSTKEVPIMFSQSPTERLQPSFVSAHILLNNNLRNGVETQGKTESKTPFEEQLGKQRAHYSQPWAVLPLLEEEQEEMV